MAAAETSDGQGDSESVSMDSAWYSGAQVMHLRASSSKVSVKSAQHMRHTESHKGGDLSKVDKDRVAAVTDGGPANDRGAGIYSSAPYLQLDHPCASANAVCSLVCYILGTHRLDSDSDAPAAEVVSNADSELRPMCGVSTVQHGEHQSWDTHLMGA